MTDTPDWIILSGSALERGLQQAARRPNLVKQVHAAVSGRLGQLATALDRPQVIDFLQSQRRFLLSNDLPGFEESQGIAQGYRLEHDDLLAYLHANIIADMDASLGAPGSPDSDGCTAWAHAAGHPALVVKNRDYRGEHGALQQVFLHCDPQWHERKLLCVGSLGSPGAFSSGMNTDGLAVVDTQIGTRDHGTGWLRYFLMTALLRHCGDVQSALAFIGSAQHAGGGALVLGDRHGRVAAVTLGHHTASMVTQSAHWVAHTNHCTDPTLARDQRLPQGDPTDCTYTRLQQVEQALAQAGGHIDVPTARALMSRHLEHGGICRHAHGDTSRTLCCTVYDTHNGTLHMSHGSPCDAPWARYDLARAAPPTAGAPL
jgi:predicted choloylglycine hydrolase